MESLFCKTETINERKAAGAVRELYRFCHTESLISSHWKGFTSTVPVREPEVIFVQGPTQLQNCVDPEAEWVPLERFNDMTYFGHSRGTSKSNRINSVAVSAFSVPYKRKRRNWDGPAFLPLAHVYRDRPHTSAWEKLAIKVWEESYVCYTYQDKCYVVNRPLLVKTNDRGMHCKDGPAMVFRDGTEVYAWEGIKVQEDNIRRPENMTLKDIHQHNSRKHILIDLCGVERYLELCKAWRPEVRGKFAKFFNFSRMLPHDKEKGYGHLYVDRPYFVNFSSNDVNGKRALRLEDSYHSLYAFWDHFKKNPLDAKHAEDIFNEEDRELWDLLDYEEMCHRGPMKFRASFQNGIFSAKTEQNYEGFAVCRHDVAPAWFKARMFRNQDALYEAERYIIKYEDGKLMYDGELEQAGSCTEQHEDQSKTIKCREPLFSGNENLPYYSFDVDLQSDTWEGLLEKWATLSFNWLGMHEDSTRMP